MSHPPATLTVTVHGANDAPVLAAQTANQNAVVGSAFSPVLPTNTFSDVDTGDTLAYSATLADGSALPAWLTFNATTRTFSGTPAAANVGTLNVRVTATDLGTLAAGETFNIAVTTAAPTNTPPTAVADTGDATERGGTANGTGGSSATGNVLTNDTDPDAGDTKTVSAVSIGSTTGTLGSALAGAFGSLVLNASGAFTYTVNETAATVQALRQSTNTVSDVFTYTMRDTAGVTSTATLTVTVHGANDAPVLAAQTANQNAVVGSAFSLVLPTTTFSDVDTGDTLAYSATLADGLGAARMVDVQRDDTDLQRHTSRRKCWYAQCQSHGHRSRQSRRQRDLQYCRNDNSTTADRGKPVQRVEHAGADRSQ